VTYSGPIPEPLWPYETAWIEAVRRPVLMDASRARERLSWRPRYDALETLRQTVAAARNR
jgi:nucleoside-diphosphate-sugar epimerase